MTNEEKARAYTAELIKANPDAKRWNATTTYMSACEWKDQQHAKEVESLVGLAVKECKQVMIDKACEWLNARLFPTVKVMNEDLIDVIDRWELIDEFRKAMTDKTNPLFEKCLANVDPDTRKEVRENMEEKL